MPDSPTLSTSYLSRLRFTTAHQRQAGYWGERRSTKRGEGIEFADYRHYTQGDALHSIDWNLYARFDKPYIRLHEAEQNQTISLWIDTSPSMNYTDGDLSRWDFTQELARSLGHIALLSGDDLYAYTYPLALRTEGLRGRGQLNRWQHWIANLEPAATANKPSPLAQARRPGIAAILTDGYDLVGLQHFIPDLAAQHFSVFLVHILTPFEREPVLQGDLRLIDSEDHSETPLTLGRHELRAYQEAFQVWQKQLRDLLSQHMGHYVEVHAERPLRQVLMEDLRHGRLLQ